MDGRSVRTTRSAASTLSDGEKLNDSTSCAITFLFFFKEILFTTVYIICKGFCFTFAPSMTQLS